MNNEKKENIFEISMVIKGPPSKVWEALIKPELVRQYMYGADLITDWKVGAPIRWQGIFEGRPYENKGTVLSVLPEKLLEYTYWSSLSELPDNPENYAKITWRLTAEKEGTRFSVMLEGDGLAVAMWKHLEFGWRVIGNGLKKIVESRYGPI